MRNDTPVTVRVLTRCRDNRRVSNPFVHTHKDARYFMGDAQSKNNPRHEAAISHEQKPAGQRGDVVGKLTTHCPTGTKSCWNPFSWNACWLSLVSIWMMDVWICCIHATVNSLPLVHSRPEYIYIYTEHLTPALLSISSPYCPSQSETCLEITMTRPLGHAEYCLYQSESDFGQYGMRSHLHSQCYHSWESDSFFNLCTTM